jgi:hypothetical protein
MADDSCCAEAAAGEFSPAPLTGGYMNPYLRNAAIWLSIISFILFFVA